MTKKSASAATKGGSAKVINNVGSGSRPGPSKHKIPTSAPTDQRGLGRKPAGSLK